MKRLVFPTITVIVLALFALAGCATADAPPEEAEEEGEVEAEEEFSVAFVFPGPINDGAFTTQGYLGLERIEENLGLETAFTELVDVPDCARVAAEYAEEGFDFVWLHSGGYISCALEVAPQYPDVSFTAYTSGDIPDAPDNFWRVNAQDHEIYYVTGAAATLTSETNTIGFIGGIDFPAYVGALNSYEQAARDFGTDTEVLSIFIGSFNDTVKGKEAAIAQIEAGADVIASAADLAVFGMIEGAKDAPGDQWVIGWPKDQCEDAPDTILLSGALDIPADIENLVNESMAGTLGGVWTLTLSTSDTVSIAFCGDNLTPEVQAEIEQLIADIRSGDVVIEEVLER